MSSSTISEKFGLADVLLPRDWNNVRTPEQFAACAKHIVANQRGHDAHRTMDRLTHQLLHNLGFGEGADVFADAAFDWHHPQLIYPLRPGGRIWCKLGLHKFVPDRESPAPWAVPEICIYCNTRDSASLHEICP